MSSNGTTPKEKSKNKGDVELTHTNRGVWLVKVPKYISDRWEKAAANTEVGKLKIKKENGAKPEVKFTLADSICAEVTGISEKDKLELIRNSSTAKEIPKVISNVFAIRVHCKLCLSLFPGAQVQGVFYRSPDSGGVLLLLHGRGGRQALGGGEGRPEG